MMNNELLKSLETNLEQLRQLDLNSEVLSPEPLTDVSSETQAVNDRYRCPAKFLDIGVNRQLFADAGYFRLVRILPVMAARLLGWVRPDRIFAS